MTDLGPGARFDRELLAFPPDLAGPELLPARMARAAARALDADGAALSLHDPDGLRTPLGASDEAASLAERLQFTYGVGPCLRAHDDGTMIAFDDADLRENWPDLHASLMGSTPFRAVLSVPLLPPLGPLVVLDLYVRETGAMVRLDREAIADVVIATTRVLVDVMRAPAAPDGDGSWWSGPDSRARTQVWQAMGLAQVWLGLDAADALAVLKAHAFATGRVTDDVAADVVAGRLSAVDLGGEP